MPPPPPQLGGGGGGGAAGGSLVEPDPYAGSRGEGTGLAWLRKSPRAILLGAHVQLQIPHQVLRLLI